MRYSPHLRGLLLLVTLCAIGYAFRALSLGEMLDAGWVDHWVRGKGLTGEALFLVAGAILTGIGLPRQVIAFLAGYGFGALPGLALGVAATTLGAALSFGYARLLARDVVEAHFPRQLAQLDAFTREAPFLKTMAIRLLPVGSNLLTCLVAGVSSISALDFLAGSALGFVPQTLIFALAGSGVNVQPGARIGVAAVLFLVSSALGVYWHRRLRRAGEGGTGAPDLSAHHGDAQPE